MKTSICQQCSNIFMITIGSYGKFCSLSYGYKYGIDPSIISHPANCRILLHSKNKEKADKSDLTLDQLLARIKEWDRKYTERVTGFEPATNSLEG